MADIELPRADEIGSVFTREILLNIGESTSDMIYAKDREGRMIFSNAATLAILGRSWPEIAGRSDLEFLDDKVEAQAFADADQRIMREGLTVSLEEVLTGTGGKRIYLSSKGPLRDSAGNIIGLIGISKDITARKAEEAQRRLLLEEMKHRVKNSLATVHAMARQTLKPAVAEAAWTGFEQRLLAMGRAHDVLVNEDWLAADVRSIVVQSLAGHGGGIDPRFHIDGPDARLDAQNALAVALVLHELATNAAKYGGLSVAQGEVAVTWHIEIAAAASAVVIHWRERGGPAVAAPAHEGFGSRLIRHALGHRAGNAAQIDFASDGLRCTLRVALVDDRTVPLGDRPFGT